MSTDLANERTLLAWVRTVLAIMRTRFAATLGLQGVSAFWELVHLMTVFCSAVMAVSAIVGIWRFYRYQPHRLAQEHPRVLWQESGAALARRGPRLVHRHGDRRAVLAGALQSEAEEHRAADALRSARGS